MTRVSHAISLFAILCLAPAGCVDSGSPGEHRTTQEIDTYLPHQGRLVLGFKNPDGRIFNFANSGHPATQVRAQGELNDGSIGGTAYTGLTFSSSDGALMRIASVIAPVAPDDTWQYVLEQQPPNTTGWEPACAAPTPLFPLDAPLPDPVPAVAMTGVWVGPLYWNLSSYVTLACKSGVAAKCVGWGFPVDKQWPHITKGGLLHWAIGGDLMEACSRMARADYCANGMPNTLDGTPIQIDNVYDGLRSHEGMEFEAAWNGKAISDGSGPANIPVVCLSKRRWSTLPLGGNCPLQLPDPRVETKARFCEDLDMEAKGALLYSSSSYMDAGLYTYTDPASQLRLTTTSLLPQRPGVLPTWTLSPAPDVPFPVAGQPVRFEASIFTAPLPVTIPDTDLVKLFSYHCHDDLITTTSDLTDQGCSPITVEGYVYPRNAPDRASLRRWFQPATKRSYTTAISPTTMQSGGWNLVETVGGVLRAAIDVNVRWSSQAGYTYAIDAQTAAGGWITSCIDSAHIGTATSFAYQGTCVGSSNAALNHADIIAFRIVATRPGYPTYTSDAQLYDGFSSDVYIPIIGPHSLLTAVEIRWPDLGPDMVYSLEIAPLSGDWMKCADPALLGDSTSYVHTGKCWSSGVSAAASKIRAIRLCAFIRGKESPDICGEAKSTGTEPIINVKLKR